MKVMRGVGEKAKTTQQFKDGETTLEVGNVRQLSSNLIAS